MDLLEDLNARKSRINVKNKTLSDLTGLSPGHISDILNGKKIPTLPTFLKLTEALGLSLNVSESSEGYLTDRRRFIEDMFYDVDQWSEGDFLELKEYLTAKRTTVDAKK